MDMLGSEFLNTQVQFSGRAEESVGFSVTRLTGSLRHQMWV